MTSEIDPTLIKAQADDTLLQRLSQERYDQSLADALNVAARVEQTVVPDISRYFSQSDKNVIGIDLGQADSGYVRNEKDMINNVARRANIPVLEGDEVSGSAGVVWEETEGGLLCMRFNDPTGALRQSSTEIRRELNQPFEQMAQKIRDGATEVMSTESFALGEPGKEDIVYSFMDGTNPSAKRVAHTRAKFVESLYAMPIHLPSETSEPTESGEGVYFDEDGNLLKILREVPRNSGIYRGMYFAFGTRVDPTQTEFNLGIEIDTERIAMERSANGDILAEPFLTTETGQALVEAINLAGLAPSAKLSSILAEQHESSSDYDKRYGGSYSELSREIAKYVNNPERSLGIIFEGDEDQIRQSLESIDIGTITNEPARILIAMLRLSVSRSQEAVRDSELPVFEGTISMRDKSCKDAETYYLGSFVQHKYSMSVVGEKPMLHKHFGGETSINLEPVVYKGIEIPAGGLFQRHQDEQSNVSYAFVRMTSFALSEQDAPDAFTWQYTETIKNRPGTKPSREGLRFKF